MNTHRPEPYLLTNGYRSEINVVHYFYATEILWFFSCAVLLQWLADTWGSPHNTSFVVLFQNQLRDRERR